MADSADGDADPYHNFRVRDRVEDREKGIAALCKKRGYAFLRLQRSHMAGNSGIVQRTKRKGRILNLWKVTWYH